MEELFRHTMELNKKYLSQGFKVLTEMSQQPRLDKNDFTFKPELYSKAFNAFAQLNLDYYNQIMELGLGMTDEFFNKAEKENNPQVEPAFVLTAKGKAGGKARMQFVLENTKTETVQCELVNSTYTDEKDPATTAALKTTFEPQTFTQEPGESHTVHIHVQIPKGTPPATYISDVHVIGFEPSFFRIILIVERPTRKTTRVQPKKRSTKKA